LNKTLWQSLALYPVSVSMCWRQALLELLPDALSIWNIGSHLTFTNALASCYTCTMNFAKISGFFAQHEWH